MCFSVKLIRKLGLIQVLTVIVRGGGGGGGKKMFLDRGG